MTSMVERQPVCNVSRSMPVPGSYAIFAPTDHGFFGLSQLKEFTGVLVGRYTRRGTQTGTQTVLIFDFSAVKMWDIAALLWLTSALHHYRHDLGLRFLLRLPIGNDSMLPADAQAFNKSADYLRRWEFNTALQNIDSDVDALLIPEQRGFFGSGPHTYYLDRKVSDDSGVLQSLISRRLVQIRNLTEPIFTGASGVTPARISHCVRSFQSQRIGDILAAQCAIEKRKADTFSDHLLTESLMNVLEHPKATIGMVAISVMGKSKELILSVADNGDSIVQTIYPRYVADLEEGKTSLASTLPFNYQEVLPTTKRAEIIHHATKAGVTCKTGPEAAGAGMGLCYIKDDTLKTFNGRLLILTAGIALKYYNDVEHEAVSEVQEWDHSWKGNLLRISIPLAP